MAIIVDEIAEVEYVVDFDSDVVVDSNVVGVCVDVGVVDLAVVGAGVDVVDLAVVGVGANVVVVDWAIVGVGVDVAVVDLGVVGVSVDVVADIVALEVSVAGDTVHGGLAHADVVPGVVNEYCPAY